MTFKKNVKILVVVCGFFGAVLLVFRMMLSDLIIKSLEKQALKKLNCKLMIDDISLKILRGEIKIKNAKLYEINNQDALFCVADLSGKADWLRIFKFRDWSFVYITAIQPELNIKKIGDEYKIDYELVEKIKELIKEEKPKRRKQYLYNDLKLEGGKLNIIEEDGRINSFILNASIPVIDADDSNMLIHLEIDIFDNALTLKSDVNYNRKTKDFDCRIYSAKLNIEKSTNQFVKYLNDFELSGSINTDIIAKGNFEELEKLKINGVLNFSDFLLKDKNTNKELLKVREISALIDLYDYWNKILEIQKIKITEPLVNFEQYKKQNNFTKLLDVKKIKNDSDKQTKIIAQSTTDISPKYKIKINELQIDSGLINYKDYRLLAAIESQISDWNFSAQNFSNIKLEKCRISSAAKINQTAELTLSGEISHISKNKYNVKSKVRLKNFMLRVFNELSLKYSAHTIRSGSLNFSGNINLYNDNIDLLLDTRILDLKLGARNYTINPVFNSPVPLEVLVELLKQDGVLKFSHRVSGNLKDKNFDLQKELLDNLKKTLLSNLNLPFSFF